MTTKTEFEAATELSGSTGRARIGKIAKLPRTIREELNARMADGEATEGILEWLNGHPEVREYLEARHKGSPITAVNLTRWRQGGFAGWLENQRTQDALAMMAEACRNVSQKQRDDLGEQLSFVVMARMAVEVQRFNEMEEGPLKSAAWQELVSALLKLRRGAFYAEKMRLEREKLFPEKPEEKYVSAEEREQCIREVLGIAGPTWNSSDRRWEGPGAAERVEEQEVEDRVRAEVRRRKAERAAAAAAANPTAPESKPSVPEAGFAAPPPNPAKAAVNPAAPANELVVPEGKPVVPETEPAVVAGKASVPETEAAAAEAKPSEAECKPAVPEDVSPALARKLGVLTNLPPLLQRCPAVMARNAALLARAAAVPATTGG